jgi:hypothetical protein
MNIKMFSGFCSLAALCGVAVTVPFMPELRVATMAAVLMLDFPMVAVCFRVLPPKLSSQL